MPVPQDGPQPAATFTSTAMPQPLPSPNPYDTNEGSHIAHFHAAYESCLDLERRHSQVKPCGTLQVLVCARFLGYMLLEAPTNAGREDFASEILRCMGDDELQKLAEAYKDHFLRVCKSKPYTKLLAFQAMVFYTFSSQQQGSYPNS